MNKILPPTARILDPRRIHLHHEPDGWSAVYDTHDGLGPGVSGCKTRREAIFHIFRSATMRIVRVGGGRFERMPPLSLIFGGPFVCALFAWICVAGGGTWPLVGTIAWGLASLSSWLRWIVLYRSAIEWGSP